LLSAACDHASGPNEFSCRRPRYTATPDTARDLRGALSYGPEFFEQRYVFRIPTHARYYYADCQLQAILVFVRLAHDRRFVGVVLFVLFVLFVFIRNSGGTVLPMITKGLQSINLVENSSGCVASC